jgi:hypothetical protein
MFRGPLWGWNNLRRRNLAALMTLCCLTVHKTFRQRFLTRYPRFRRPLSNSSLTMAETCPDAKEHLENEKGTSMIHGNGSHSADHVSYDVTQDAFCRHGIDEKHEKRILRKLDIRLLPFISLLYLLSYL